MIHSKFKSLVDANRELLRSSPSVHARRLAMLSFLGLAYPYVFAFGCLLGFILCAWGAYVFEHGLLAALAGLFLAFLIRFVHSIYFALLPPSGLGISKKDAPELFAEIESIARSVGAKVPGTVLIDSRFNAAAASLPGRWLLSPGRDYLILGYPLLTALTRQEFRSVLAHELGHFSLAHPSHTRLAWRAFQTWSRIKVMLLSAGGFLSKLMLGAFADWYLPRLEAMLAVLSRTQEFEADKLESSVTGPDVAARSLAVHSLLGKQITKGVTKPFWEKARTMPEPPPGFIDFFARFLRSKRPSEEELAKFIENALPIRSIADDSHPSVGERIANLGFESSMPVLRDDGPDAAVALLGPFEDDLRPRLELQWKSLSKGLWFAVHAESQAARKALSEMLNVRFKDGISLEEQLKRSRLLELACGADAALRPLEDAFEQYPDSAEAKFNLGRITLGLGKPGGDVLMLEAMKENPAFIHPGVEILSDYYRDEGLADDFASLMTLRESAPPQLASAGKVRMEIPKPFAIASSSKISPHVIASAELEDILKTIVENGNVERAYLALVTPAADSSADAAKPYHVLVVVRKFSLLAFRGEDDTALALALSLTLAKHQALKVMPFDSCPLSLRLKLKLVKSSLIYKV